MKRVILSLCLITGIALLAYAAPPDRLPPLLGPPEAMARLTAVVVGGSPPAASGPQAWYGPTVTGTSYSGTGAALCEQITIVQAGNLSKISMHVSDKGSANLKLALYNGDGTALLDSGGIILNASIVNADWNEVAVDPVVPVDASQVVMLCFSPSADMEFYKDDAATDLGRYGSVTYANFPQANISDEDSDAHHGLRVYVE
jgi:hypothetical protein